MLIDLIDVSIIVISFPYTQKDFPTFNGKQYDMNRRKFTKTSLAASASIIGSSLYAQSDPFLEKDKPFKLNYAPHLGMFKNHTDGDPIRHLEFIAERGFSAFEDNEMKSRDVKLQSQMVRRWNSWVYLWAFL